jgi:hypothetical protein
MQLEAIELDAIASDEDTIDLLRRLAKILKAKLDEALLIGAQDAAGSRD